MGRVVAPRVAPEPDGQSVNDSCSHPCARCAAVQKTCCQRAEILVTAGDRERIAAVVGHADFFERRVPLDPAYREVDPSDPDWTALTVAPDGSRVMLKRRADGDCTFLGAAGCTLAEETRPLVCRLYPFAYDERGLRGEDADYCPKAMLLPRPDGTRASGMVEVLDMSHARAEVWRSTLYRELRADAARGEAVR